MRSLMETKVTLSANVLKKVVSVSVTLNGERIFIRTVPAGQKKTTDLEPHFFRGGSIRYYEYKKKMERWAYAEKDNQRDRKYIS